MDIENLLIVENHFVIKSDLIKDDIKKLEKELKSVEKSLANIRNEMGLVKEDQVREWGRKASEHYEYKYRATLDK